MLNLHELARTLITARIKLLVEVTNAISDHKPQVKSVDIEPHEVRLISGDHVEIDGERKLLPLVTVRSFAALVALERAGGSVRDFFISEFLFHFLGEEDQRGQNDTSQFGKRVHNILDCLSKSECETLGPKRRRITALSVNSNMTELELTTFLKKNRRSCF